MRDTDDQKMTVVVTGANRGLGLALVAALTERHWTVFACHRSIDPGDLSALVESSGGSVIPVQIDIENMESVKNAAEVITRRAPVVDMLINNAGMLGRGDRFNAIRGGLDFDEIAKSIDVNSLGPLRVTQQLLPLMNKSSLRRLCFVSSEAASITKSFRTAWFGYCMSKAALNMATSILFNDLRPDGFTFRLYHPGWMRTCIKGELDTAAKYETSEAATSALSYFLESEIDEDALIMRDIDGQEWPW